MIDFLQRFRIGKRLGVAFAMVLLMMAAISLSALYAFASLQQNVDQVAGNHIQRLRHANTVLDANNAFFNHLQAMIITASPERLAEFHDQFKDSRKVFSQAISALETSESEAPIKAQLVKVAEARDIASRYDDQVLAAVLEGDKDTATRIMREHAIPGLNALHDAVNQLVDLEEASLQQSLADARDMAMQARQVIIAIMVISVLCGIALSILITRSLTGPLAQAANAASALAAGRLDGAPLKGGNDEVGTVLAAIQKTREAVTGLKDGLDEMARQHDIGQISFSADTTALHGDYKLLGESINAMVHEHKDAALAAGQLAARYARGELSADFPRVPGEKQVLMNAMDEVKAAIQRISAEILHMSEAAVQGNFSVRGDENAFEFGFREMVANLNLLMATADGSLGSLSLMLKAIAAGDLTVRMDGDYAGVFASMRDDANATVGNLTGIISHIQQASGSVNSAASEIATGNQELSQRTEQQAANLEETAASMEELTSTVRQNAEHARKANELVIGASSVAIEGGKVVGEVVQTMSQIEESSRRIADIISVIDGIAFQTNILALNAAVEAARAGEQGRGFAVVASEVRSLAQRSADAAKEIKTLIDDSVGKVADGSQLVRRAGDTMEEIVSSVQRVTSIMADISAASQEQSAGIEQVSQTVMQMDEATQQNAALVEEATAAARSMEEQANQLSAAVSVFRLANGATAAQAIARNSAPSALKPADKAAAQRTAPATARKTAPARPVAVAEADDGQWQEF